MNPRDFKRRFYRALRTITYVSLLSVAAAYVFSGISPEDAKNLTSTQQQLVFLRGVIAICAVGTMYLFISSLSYLGLRKTLSGAVLNTRLSMRSIRPLTLLLMCVFVFLSSPILMRIPHTLSPLHAIVPLAAATMSIVWLLLPPIALVLGASDEALGSQTLGSVVEVIRPLRVVSLLRPGSMPLGRDTGLFWWRYRTMSSSQWEQQVQGLLDLVAFVFVDARRMTPHVARELALLTKAIPPSAILFIIDPHEIAKPVKDCIAYMESANEVVQMLGSAKSKRWCFHLGVEGCERQVASEWMHNKIPEVPKIYVSNEDVAETIMSTLHKK